MNLIKSLIIILIFTISLQAQILDERVASTLIFAEQQVLNTVNEVDTTSNNRFPRYVEITQSNKWISNPDHKWTSGFFPGCLWYMYKNTNNPLLKKYAVTWTNWLQNAINSNPNDRWPDFGLIYMPSYGNGFSIANDSSYIPIIVDAAQKYIDVRWNTDLKIFDSYDKSLWANNEDIISGAVDQLMNIEILYKATELSGDTSFSSIANAYALKIAKYNIRDDYSTFQVSRYQLSTGNFLMSGTVQGAADSSTWARGQAWSTYGFTMCYHYTQDERFLNTDIGLAHYFIDNLPQDDGVTYWDFDVPYNSSEPKDASATAIVASALFGLLNFTDNEAEKEKFKNAAFAMLESLASDKYLADPNITNAILLHSTAHKPAELRVDVPLIYADYYFIEAMLRYQEYRKITSVEPSFTKTNTRPKTFVLMQNYPNPFNPNTTIKYRLIHSDWVELIIYNSIGQKIRTLVDEIKSSGEHNITFSAGDLPSGVYYYKLRTGENIKTKKMLLLQ